MQLRDEGILYRRVVWRPDEAQWWACRGEVCWPERGAAKLRTLKPHELPRKDRNGVEVPPPAGKYEEGLSCNYAHVPDADVVACAARHDLEKYKVIGFLVGEVASVQGLSIRHDPQEEGDPAWLNDSTADRSHCLIVPESYELLIKAPTRKKLIDLAWEVDPKTGQLARRYAEIKLASRR